MGCLDPASVPTAATPPADPPLLIATGLTCRYGRLTALDGVDLTLRRGEVTALLGDNGAGKSTLIALLSGLRSPQAGWIMLDGAPCRFASPAEARAAGIATVFQNLALVEDRSIAENLFLGQEPTRWGVLIDRRRMDREARATFARLGLELPPMNTAVRHLSGGQRQAIAVARTVLGGARVVILDEPTAALGVGETQKVLNLVKQLCAQGAAVLLVSHNMDNVFEVAHRAVVLRLGRKVAERTLTDTSRTQLVAAIMGATPGVEDAV